MEAQEYIEERIGYEELQWPLQTILTRIENYEKESRAGEGCGVRTL